MSKKEELFHDEWAESTKAGEVLVAECFEACTSPENRLIMRKLGDIAGKKILDLGCGAGEGAVYFAKKGAQVVAADISTKMLQLVQQVAANHNVLIAAQQADAEQLPFESEYFDIVYAANLLHHVNIEKTIAEASRVLKRGGVFVSYDPLAYNPLINIYRHKAYVTRTKDEHPLKTSDVRIVKKYFSHVTTDAKWLFTLWIFVRYYLIDRIDPNKERYWKRILKDNKKLEKEYYRLEKVDNFLLAAFPFIKIFCWNIIIFGIK